MGSILLTPCCDTRDTSPHKGIVKSEVTPTFGQHRHKHQLSPARARVAVHWYPESELRRKLGRRRRRRRRRKKRIK